MKNSLTLILLLLASQAFGTWGQTGHRTIGQIAENHLTNKARIQLQKVLNGKSLAYVSTWMDEIRSDSLYDYAYSWHWVTLPDSLTYAETEKNPNGDVIQTITRLISGLKSKSLDKKQETEHVKMLVHLIGDIHQPLHVGTGFDQGGNDAKVKYFGSATNLHSVWDSRMIDGSNYSFSELALELDQLPDTEIKRIQNSTVIDWANESKDLRNQVYDLPDHGNLSYEYVYRKWHIVERRLVEAGLRLARVLNEIYK